MDPCDETIRIRAKEVLREQNLLDPDTIQNPAYLVIGAKPGEDTKGREFYDNPAYYTLDNTGVGPRHISADFNELFLMTRLSKLYCGKFDCVIFDYSVYKFFDTSRLDFLLRMVKPDGFFITELATLGISFDAGILAGLNQNAAKKAIKKLRTDTEERIFEDLKKTGFRTNIMKFNSIINENSVAKAVYEKVIEDGNGNCILLQKSVKPAKKSFFSMFRRSGGRIKKSRRKTRRVVKSKQ